MKRYIKNRFHYVLGLVVLTFLMAGCDKENNLGLELLPKDDLIEVKNVVLKDGISSFTFREDSIRTDESSNSMLGSFNDPVFGNTTINYATQFRLQSFPDFGENPVADSVKLILRYRTLYGDTETPLKISVYELESPIFVDEIYYQDVDLKSLAYAQSIGEIEYTPAVALDSTTNDTLQQVFAIPLDIALGQKLVDADSTILANNDLLMEYFKGLYLEVDYLNSGGAIMSLNELTTSTRLGSGLVVYYNNDENKAAEQPDTLFTPLLVSKFGARVNSIEHDYTTTTFYPNLNSEQNEDSLIYVQATGGLKSRIFIEDISSWQDSVNVAINKAELVFQIDSIISDVHNFNPPSQLLFTVVDENGNEFLPRDYVFNPAFYGGRLDSEDYTYRFNITQHLQEIIEGAAENFGFFLTPANKNNEANRVVLKGSKSSTGIKLIITYTKFNI